MKSLDQRVGKAALRRTLSVAVLLVGGVAFTWMPMTAAATADRIQPYAKNPFSW
jgi:hypothetical protein